MRRLAQYAGDDTQPYDRELIRSGAVSRRSGGSRRQAGFEPRLRQRAPRPRRSGSLGRFVRNVFVLVLLAIVIVGIILFMRAAAFNASVSSAAFSSTALLGPLNGTGRVNVLLVGYASAEHEGAYLADSIQILSIDPATDTTTTIPVPRDLWIEGVDQFSQNGKVNEVFAAGHSVQDDDETARLDRAATLLAEVLSEVTGLEIHHWLSIDFNGFRDMVDAVGGVTVENPVAFMYTGPEENHNAGYWDEGPFEAGEIHLSGEEALWYARARYTSVPSESNDFARSVRQARVLSALRAELGEGGVSSILPGLALMDAMEGRVRTDLSAIDLFLLSSHLDSDRRVELREEVVLIATTNTIGQYILIPVDWSGPGDYGGLREYLESELANSIGSAASDAP